MLETEIALLERTPSATQTETHEVQGKFDRAEATAKAAGSAARSAAMQEAFDAQLEIQPPEEHYTLSGSAQQYLAHIFPDRLAGQPFTDNDTHHLVEGLLLLRGTPDSRSRNRDYRAILGELFAPGGSVGGAAVATDTIPSTLYAALRSFANGCLRNMQDPMTVGDVIKLSNEAYEPLPMLEVVVVEREASPHRAMGLKALERATASRLPKPLDNRIPDGRSVNPKNSTTISNNPYAFPLDPIPTPRATEDDTPLAWQTDALCAQTDPEAFFPDKGGSTRNAKKICESCDVRDACLEYALSNDERFGIWGGLSERERRKLKRRVG